MKLRPFDPSNVSVRRGGGGGVKAGGIGCGTIIIAALGYFIFGADPMATIGAVEGMQQSAPQQTGPGNESAAQICDDNAYSQEACNALASLNQTWAARFKEAGIGERFKQPDLVFYSGAVRSACGNASSSVGPFYCPGDQGMYIDVSFYDQLRRMSGEGGDFARLYVVAHEYGHHVQTLTGVAGQIRSAQQSDPRNANRYQVLMELHADCYAGVWAGRNRNLIEPGDFEEGMNAAAAIGDDTLTKGRVSEENFTHGTSQQRMQALKLGMETGSDDRCDEILNVS